MLSRQRSGPRLRAVGRFFVVGLLLCVLLPLDGALAQGASSRGRYIVVLQDAADPDGVAAEHERKHGAKHDLVFRHALKGYAAEMSEGAAQALRSDPRVLSVEPDTETRAARAEPCGDPPLQPCQALGNAINRVDGDLSSTRSGDGRGRVPINVAVLDGGIDVDHPDLNVVGGKDCFSSGSFDDRDGHGTMVAGFIGALDNSIGRVGVAPGAQLWAVRVLRPDGSGSTSRVICGLDFVTATRTDSDPRNDIAVANLSLGGPRNQLRDGDCASTRLPMHLAVCRAVRAGVVVVASAGNDGVDLASEEPAAYEEVLTVTAMADFDGQPGGLRPPSASCVESLGTEVEDDSAAFFSNYATLAEDQAHTVAAPGVCVNSTFPDGQYATDTGTSFAAPVAAGTVALCLHTACRGMTPRQVIRKIVADARTYNRANPGYGYEGDPLRPFSGRYYGWLIRAGLY
jgi:subtilisin